jgi:alanine racemase
VSRGTRAVLRLEALNSNLTVVRRLAPESRVIAVVKANAYGHGLEPVVQTLSGAAPAGVDGFAVATLTEGRRIRACGVKVPVLLLEGITAATELAQVQEHDLQLVVHSDFQVGFLEQAGSLASTVKVWLKVDTGMHRLGFAPEKAAGALRRLRAITGVDPDIVLMSHLANADDTNDQMTRRQTQRFVALARDLQITNCSLANSAGIIAWPETRQQAVRAGLMLYGVSPLLGQNRDLLGLRPCMTLKSSLIAISHCQADDAIGYGGVWRCPEAMPVGVVAIGYGDGYPRRARNATPVLVNGVRCPLVGHVSMDMLTIDLRPMPEAAIGDEVVLWGYGLPVEEVAAYSEMIPYELICGVTQRVETEYR